MIEVESVSNENMSVFYIHCSNPELYSYLLLFIRNQKSHCHLKEPTPTPGGLHIVKILEILNKAVFELLIWIIPCAWENAVQDNGNLFGFRYARAKTEKKNFIFLSVFK